MERKYFGTDGIRGLVGEYPITPEFCVKLGRAAGKVLANSGNKQIVIGKDTRISGYMLESALESGLISAGVGAIFVGPMPTPAIAYLTRTLRAQAGIMISASHNPFYDNGIKFFDNKGEKLSDAIELEIENLLNQPLSCVSSENLGKASRVVDASGRYIEFCKNTFSNSVSLEGLKIVVDCANGATYNIAPSILSELGAKVIKLCVEPDGFNINHNCGATNCTLLAQKVLENSADIGIAFDGDGDRLIMVDHLGNIVDGDSILFIIARASLKRGKLKGGVIGTQMSNLGLERALAQLAIPFARAKVGDRYVLELLKEKNWLIGGESSGHIINLAKNTTGDGIIAALEVLEAMIESNLQLADLTKVIEKVPQVLKNVKVANKSIDLNEPKLSKLVNQLQVKLADEGRILLRKSGTEPLIRVMVEATNQELAQYCADNIAEYLNQLN